MLRCARDDSVWCERGRAMSGPTDTARFPWRELMAVGFGRLRLTSAAFWAMTPRELASAIEGLAGVRGAPPDRAMLDDMMRRFPDRV